MSKAERFGLTAQDHEALDRALEVFVITTEEVLEEWFPQLRGRQWKLDGNIVTIEKET